MSSVLRMLGRVLGSACGRESGIPFAHSRPTSLSGSEEEKPILLSCKIDISIHSAVYPIRLAAERATIRLGKMRRSDLYFAGRRETGAFSWNRMARGKGYALLLAGVMSVGSLAGCGGEEVAVVEQVLTQQEEDAVLVEVGQRSIRLSDYQRYFARLPAAMRREFAAEQFLQAMVEEELLVQEAEQRGLGREPAFLRAMAVEQRQLLQRVLYERVNIVQPMVSEEELQAYFQASPYNRQVRFSLLMVRDEGQLSMILAELEKGADFVALSMKRSQDPRILERGADRLK